MANTSTLRILDAALNRAGEGLRVVEDYVRFVLDDRLLTSEVKSLRHELVDAAKAVNSSERHAARNTNGDVGATITTHAEQNRSDAWAVCAASLKRTQQALRSLEEFGKLVDTDFASRIESLRYRSYTLEKAIDTGRTSCERLAEVQLCVLIDAQQNTDTFAELVTKLVNAGVGMLQLRDKRLDDRELIDRARVLRRLTRGTNSLAVVNDRADIAAAADADGVHLGQEDLPVKDARAIVGSRMVIGVSTHDISQARAAVLDGANYLGAGPTFPSHTKSFERFAGLDYLREVAAETRLPTFAIGGIHADNLPDVLATGISRIAVGSAITAAASPHSAATKLLDMLKRTRKELVISH